MEDALVIDVGCMKVHELSTWLSWHVFIYGGQGEVWINDRNGKSNEVVSACRLNCNDVILEPRQDSKETQCS